MHAQQATYANELHVNVQHKIIKHAFTFKAGQQAVLLRNCKKYIVRM